MLQPGLTAGTLPLTHTGMFNTCPQSPGRGKRARGACIFRRNVAVTLQYPDKDLQSRLEVINQACSISDNKRYFPYSKAPAIPSGYDRG